MEDLIYANKNYVDLGIIDNYNFDLAFGNSENNFELKLSLDQNVLEEDYLLYIDGTEYGGIIDSVSPSNKSNTITYSGRTWQGVLDSKIISPLSGQDYYVCNGDLLDIVENIIDYIGMSDMFVLDRQSSTTQYITSYLFRYDSAYTGICSLLSCVNYKINLVWKNKIVNVIVKMVDNYSISSDIETELAGISVKKVYNHCNHLICMGQGDLSERAVISIYTDIDGNIQPYINGNVAYSDVDYILDDRNKVVDGKDEIVEKYDYPNAEIVYNYVKMNDMPIDWKNNYVNYFVYSYPDGFVNIERNLSDVYSSLSWQPADWSVNYKKYFYYDSETKNYENVKDLGEVIKAPLHLIPSDWYQNYGNYFESDGQGGYKNVTSVENISYSKLQSCPANWQSNYSDYYITDGVNFSNVSSVSKEIYVMQVRQPSNWKSNWKDYYCIYMNGKYTKNSDVALYANRNKAPKWLENTFFNKESKNLTPNFSSFSSVYVQVKTYTVPTFVGDGKYYSEGVNNIPQWQSGIYWYLTEDVDIGVVFYPNAYYNKVGDRYYTLVTAGKEKLSEIYNSDEINISIDSNSSIDYDVGDIIGARDNTTGIFVSQPISKKIVKIEKNKKSIEYEVTKIGS